MKKFAALFCLIFFTNSLCAQKTPVNDLWWKRNNLRVIQMNLPSYEAATINADSIVADLITYSANTLLINAGGIMAFYPTKLDFHYTNPFMKENVLGELIKKCHQNNIKVIVRFDFSRVHESIYKAHPDWCYISSKGERIINTDMYVVSINAPYVQEKAFKIIEEVIDMFPIDGIFLNMPGYQVNNPYEGKYHGIDQNDFDKKAFAAYAHGKVLPTEENKADTLYQKYLEFKKHTVENWSERLHKLVKSRNEQIAICTYSDKFVDIIRHESQSMTTLPYWPYTASDNVGNAVNSFPDHIISNASIQQISFQSRYNAVEPQEVQIRLYENIANGSGLDLSMMGDMRGYEDERNYEVIRKVYAFHKKHEQYFGKYKSLAKIAIVAPGAWPNGEPMQEYRGIQLMLREAHIPFDIIEDGQIGNLSEKVKAYKLIILPEITYLKPEAVQVLKEASKAGTNLIATNRTLFDSPETLQELFGAKIEKKDNDGAGNYLVPDNRSIFKSFPGQKMLFWKFNLGLYDLSGADQKLLPVLAKGRPGPPEIIGGHEPTGYYALGIKNHAKSKALIFPVNLGRIYYMHGYQEHKNLLLDAIHYVLPEAPLDIQTNAPQRVEVILKEFVKNNVSNKEKINSDGLILHLVNLTGFSGNTYFEPLPVYNLNFKIKSAKKPARIFSLSSGQPIKFTYDNTFINLTISKLDGFEGVVMEY
ncbi:family 10 glycosylhydrolase [Dyadobacter fanqingshengii]|uniref:Family 10 glycosylhydrolase n=1 Tax=Dyadobacter fanqingshengii TaxID=2906443 RepID=A0A9X1T9I2_9BACT|nr:family 10 glycosylhydrolase [Dyadobacter fanqingshengii]MCF0040009.1 family 10 glycosylhydrolase [Dyadobacter fanqingshengii]USJ38239.1 family 10 glycosylhydrolase [Dyadobacter fanqingshengii]